MSSFESDIAPPAAEPKPAPQTAGAWLRHERQQRGLHIAAMAATLKVPQAKLEALEADRYKDLTDMTFVRALAKAMCRVLKIDATQVLSMLPSGHDKELDVSLGINAPFREYGGREESSAIDLLRRPAVWGVGLLVLAAAGVYFMPPHLLDGLSLPSAETAAQQQPAPVLAEPTASLPVAAAPSEAAVQLPQFNNVPAPAASVPQVAASMAVVAAPVASVVAPKPAPVASAAPVVAAPPAGAVPVRVKATAATWIEVIDAGGQALFSGVVPAGETQEWQGLPPLKVRIGNVAGTQLSFRGNAVDLSQSKDNVARLELK